MAYLIDTLLYEKRLAGIIYIPDEGGEPVERYELERVPLDLTQHWITKFPTKDPTKEQRYALRSVLPSHTHSFRTAIGDLNGDNWNDYVFALEPDTGFGESDGLRDLQIVFSATDGFSEKLFLPGYFPGRSYGGFHDPIGEECCSGISISGDTLIVELFSGSAWKSQTRDYYRYSTAQAAFFLIKEEGRHFHGPSVGTMDEELAELELVLKEAVTGQEHRAS